MATGDAVRYARSTDGTRIAYRAEGSGPGLLEIGGWGAMFSVDSVLEQPRWSRFERHVASFSRLVRLDLRGLGLSDPSGGPFDVGLWVDDALAALDAAGVDEAVVLGSGYGGVVALRLAATHPVRVRRLILANAFARIARADDYPAGAPAQLLALQRSAVDEGDVVQGNDIDVMAPSIAEEPDTRMWWARAASRAAGPATARKIWELLSSCDERDLALTVDAATLVLQTSDNRFIRSGHAQWLDEHLQSSRLVTVPGSDHVLWAHPRGEFLAEIEEFVTGGRAHFVRNRQLAAILFTDLVGSTDRNARVGDASWSNTLARHDAMCTEEIRRFGGRLIKTMGDGVLATFPNVTSGARAGAAIASRAHSAGFEIRAGLHAAEIEMQGDDVFGIGVAIAARTLASAAPNKLTVTRTVVDLLAGSELHFESHTTASFKGVPGEWELFTLT